MTGPLANDSTLPALIYKSSPLLTTGFVVQGVVFGFTAASPVLTLLRYVQTNSERDW